MGFWSGVMDAVKTAGSAGLSLTDATFGWSDFSAGQSKLKDAYKKAAGYNQSMASWSALNEPRLTKQGLVNAGYNPMLALGDIQSASTGAISPVSGGSALSLDTSKSTQSRAVNAGIEGIREDNANKRREGRFIDSQIERQKIENAILSSEASAVEVENANREFAAEAQSAALHGLDSDAGSPAWHLIRDNFIKELEREGYTRSRAHAIWEDVLPTIKTIGAGVGAAYMGSKFGKGMQKLERLTNPNKIIKLPLKKK